jgi:hypothetical protein
MALRLGQQEPARRGVPAADLCPARPSVAAVRMVQVLPKAAEVTAAQPLVGAAEAVVAQRLVPPAVWAVAAAVAQEVPQASAAQPKAAGVALAARDAAAEPQPGVASDAEVQPPEEAAVPDVAAVAPRQEAERALAGAVQLPGAAAPVAEVRRQAVRDVQGVLPSAAAWAAAPSTRFREDLLARPLAARSAHAKARLRVAQP